jgi:hypothetical protein
VTDLLTNPSCVAANESHLAILADKISMAVEAAVAEECFEVARSLGEVLLLVTAKTGL